jgi:hydroxymethylbilane synthase
MAALVIATRGSALALRQVEMVIAALEFAVPGIETSVRVVRTEGDRDQESPLEEIGGQGVFVKDIERALLRDEAHIAVHSLKDMPAQDPRGLVVAAVLARDDARDVLISRGGTGLADLPPGARIGTDSRRRAVQILALRPDAVVTSIRGNVDTRVAKVVAGEYDAVVLAAAGIARLGLGEHVSQTFESDQLLPAPGQAVIAVQCRADDHDTMQTLHRLDHAPTRAAITAERAFLRRLGAGCRLPVGAYAGYMGTSLILRGLIADDAGKIYTGKVTGIDRTAEILGKSLAESLLLTVSRGGGAPVLGQT